MTMLKFFRLPFATGGTRTAIPDTAPVDGSVSYSDGYGVDYQRPKSDPLSKNIPRDKWNQLQFDVTNAIKELQSQGIPDFITTALNGGAAYSYSKNAIVRWTDGELYVSLINANTGDPSDGAKWGFFGANLTNQLQTGFNSQIQARRFISYSLPLPNADVTQAAFQTNRTFTAHGSYGFLDNVVLDYTGMTGLLGSAGSNDNGKLIGTGAADHRHGSQVNFHVNMTGGGTLGVLSGFWCQFDINGGVISEVTGLKVLNPTGAGGTVNNMIGAYIGPLARGAINNYGLYLGGVGGGSGQNYQIYAAGANQTSRFNGGLVLGSDPDGTPGALLSVVRQDATLGHLLLFPAAGKQVKVAGLSGNQILRIGAPTADVDDATIENAASGNLRITARTGFRAQFPQPPLFPQFTVANLNANFPAATNQFCRAFAIDATASTFNSVVAGGGTLVVPVFSDGAAWRIG